MRRRDGSPPIDANPGWFAVCDVCFPPSDGVLEATASFIVAARDVELEHVVNMSQIVAREGHPSPLTRQHWLSERLLDSATFGVTHVRPSFFAENILLFGHAMIKGDGRVFLPLGEGKHAPISGPDQGRAIATILVNPETHRGKTYTLTGTESLTMDRVAELAARVLGKPVSYVSLPPDQWVPIATEAGLSPFQAKHISLVGAEHAQGGFDKVTDHFEQIVGSPPRSLEESLREVAPLYGL